MRISGRVLDVRGIRLAPAETECRCESTEHRTILRHHCWGDLGPYHKEKRRRYYDKNSDDQP